MFTNSCVEDATIRLVCEKSSIKPVSKKYIIDDIVTIDKNRTNDIQRPEEEDKQLQSTATTNTVI